MHTMAESNVELARRGYEAITRGDYDAIARLLDPDVKWHAGDPTAEFACKNRGQALRFMRRPERRGPGELVEVLDAGDDRVVVVTRRDSEDGESPVLGANVTTFRDGKVVEMVHYPDRAAALAAVGITG